jgi:RimJ/RimL family protein N-acetyltransferase
MNLTILTRKNCELVRQWRNQDISIYRTPFLITEEMQLDFYENVICNRNSNHRYWAVMSGTPEVFLGMVGLTDISLENRNAEISIVLDPEIRGSGNGEKAFDLLLDKGFNELNLDSIFAECYEYNGAVKFWDKMAKKYKADKVRLPMRKFYKGLYFASYFYTFVKEKL